MRVSVDEATCVGHGRCYALAPEVYGADDFGHCEILVADGLVPAEAQHAARIGAEACPEHAITLEDHTS
ncbi:MAG: ferredoxin [Actinobacteria bacterium]|nr:ferredoxin [Actinomycetota bacterium]